jgi:hypothetical protein
MSLLDPSPGNRMFRALAKAGLSAVQTYKDEYLSPAENPNPITAMQAVHWDDYESRIFRYNHNNYYYSNKAYKSIVSYAQRHRIVRGLYKHVRGIYNPVFRLVELHASKCYRGNLDTETFSRGAIPLTNVSASHTSAIGNLWKWSNMGSLKTIYPRGTSRFGDMFIKVVDDVFKNKVRLELVHPAYITYADITPQGYIDAVVIGYWRNDDNPFASPWYYEEVITKDSFSTWRDGEPYAEYQNSNGVYITAWPNEYGFVPMVLTRAIELEHNYGGSLFFATLDKIDELNDLASVTNDQIRKIVNPMWWLEGVSSISNVTTTVTGETERDRVPVMMGPLGSKPTAMNANLSLADAAQSIKSLLSEIEADHPELSLHRMREGERVTGPGVTTAYDDAIQRIEDFRGVSDSGLLRAHQMALSIGGFRGYDGFGAFDLNSYDAGDIDFQIAERPVLADNLTKSVRIDKMRDSNAPDRWIWSELGKTEDEIAEAEAEKERERQEMKAEIGNRPDNNAEGDSDAQE